MEMNFYCHECKAKFNADVDAEPTEVKCPDGHALGVWSSFEKFMECKVEGCGWSIVECCRRRHDKKNPEGETIETAKNEDMHKVLEHFMVKHPEVMSKISGFSPI